MSLANQEIDKQAAYWATKRDLGPLAPEEEASFRAWLVADVRHLGAYGRAEAVLGRLERLSGVGLDVAPERPLLGHLNRRTLILTVGIAASLAVIVQTGSEITDEAHAEQFATAVGQTREVVLSDGSVVSLNTHTKIVVRYTRKVRDITLLQGEALFDVKKNKDRPFIVSAGDTNVRAVGTSFMVSMLPRKPIEVLVKEGVVELQRSTTPDAIPVRASANIQAIAPHGAPITTVAMPEEQLVRNLEWQRGRIALDNRSLKDAADEFARYSEVRILVDPSVSNRTVTGLFASNDPVGFAKAAASVLKLQVEIRDSEVRIFEDNNKLP